MKLYVGNLSYSSTERDLRSTFETCGTVDSVSIISDRQTGRSKGFGFVEMSDPAEAREAINTLNESLLGNRTINVNEAIPREERSERPNRRR